MTPAAAIPVFLAFKFRAWLLSFGPLLTLRSATAWIAFVGFPIFLLSAAPLGYSLATQAEDLPLLNWSDFPSW